MIEEFIRCDLELSLDKVKIIDALRIYHLMEKRNLSSAYKFYCNKNLENAFIRFIEKTPPTGKAIICIDSKKIKKIHEIVGF